MIRSMIGSSAFALSMVAGAAQATPYSIPVGTDPVTMKFDLPSLDIESQGPEGPGGFQFLARSGNLVISLHSRPPTQDCPNAKTDEELGQCFYDRLPLDPGIYRPSIQTFLWKKGGAGFIYVVKAPPGQGSTTTMNTHKLLVKNGKYIDFHVSVVDATKEEMRTTATLIDQVEFVDLVK
ncbi:hypothetical protein BH10PSE17_BH10PSE17_27000 [soil metagenome]